MDGQTAALTFAERARRVVEEDAKAYDLMAAKAALFDEMRFAISRRRFFLIFFLCSRSIAFIDIFNRVSGVFFLPVDAAT